MDHDVFSYDDAYSRPRRRINYFAWTIAILLLTGFALAAWLGSYYIFGHPERPDSYKFLKKLDKIDPPKRFELTAAPQGEFLTAKQLYDRYSALRPAELAKTNGELARNYIRNFQRVRGLVPYVVGRFTIMEARELGPDDIFTSGMVALANAAEHGQLLMEHVYPAHAEDAPLMKKTLAPGLEIKLERTHDISAVIHADRLSDGRIMITAIPLLYGSYAVTKGTGTFSLEPPTDLNLAAGWPLYKESVRRKAEIRLANARVQSGAPVGGASPGAGGTTAQNALVPVEQAEPVGDQVQPPPKVAAAESPKIDKLARNTTAAAVTPAATAAAASPPVIAQKPAATSPPATAAPAPVTAKSPPAVAAASPQPTRSPVTVAMNSPKPVRAQPVDTPVNRAPEEDAPAPQMANPAGPSANAQAVPTDGDNALASTAGGGSWKTFPPGRMPIGRLITPNDLPTIADRGVAGERIYLKGQFVVNFTDAHRAVLRPRTRMTESMLNLGGGGMGSMRIVVEFPEGYIPPPQGAVVNRDDARPYEIVDVRKQDDGQLNIFVREIMQP